MNLSNKIINKIIKLNISVATAESCTGGLLAYNFIKYKGASNIFKEGIICYSNNSKIKILKVKREKIYKYGAVSKEVAKEMTENLYKLSKCKLCLTTTGIAGPTGNTKNKPIGLIFVGIKYKNNTKIFKKHFKGSRIEIQKQTVNFILNKINYLIFNK